MNLLKYSGMGNIYLCVKIGNFFHVYDSLATRTIEEISEYDANQEQLSHLQASVQFNKGIHKTVNELA